VTKIEQGRHTSTIKYSARSLYSQNTKEKLQDRYSVPPTPAAHTKTLKSIPKPSKILDSKYRTRN
jgi:hypothetical protein